VGLVTISTKRSVDEYSIVDFPSCLNLVVVDITLTTVCVATRLFVQRNFQRSVTENRGDCFHFNNIARAEI